MPLAPEALGPTITIGEILAEIVATTVGDGFTEPQPLVGPYPSGAPVIFISQCGRLAGDAGMIGAVGTDAFGQLNLAWLRENNVRTDAVAEIDDLPTGTAFVRYRTNGDRDFVFNMWSSASGRIDWTDEAAALVAQAGHLHVIGTLMGHEKVSSLILRAATLIRARGGSVSLDPNIRPEIMTAAHVAERIDSVLALTDLVLPSGDELALLTGIADPDAACAALFDKGISEVALKRGARGARIYCPGEELIEGMPFVVDEVDPTGAGDCFGGAYVALRRRGSGPEHALRYAMAAGARNVTRRGPAEGIGTLDELDAFIAATDRTTT